MFPGMIGGGTQKIEIGKPKPGEKATQASSEYEAMKKSMLAAQAQFGSGIKLKDLVDPQYGNSNYPGLAMGENQGTDLALGTSSYANRPAAPSTAKTAELGFFSATASPQKDTELMGLEAQQGIRQRVLGEPGGLNDRAALYNTRRA